ncbi:MAG: PQQ-binding-like beta-propeller repeat protein [Verrucomicrobiota bacterium]|jgi:outer membrane protein assembly factor BamB|nr:quinonprotein alcohol dehydrogenase [Verrucomicrobiaceae bacterium]MED5258565.1 PQQ-binding-like beta-propeller repeat protein [Verrucomicrobiota bacterium]|tara:strand:- start:779 stop:2071 length:1293 start_codon:yes stop_codon:yes gene_type:complete
MPNKKHYLYLLPILLSIGYAEPTLKDQWPEFRGPNGNGIVVGERGLPTTWSEEKNIAWKTKIDGKAWSSPVVWDDQIWITNSSADGKLMEGICINKKDGKIKYRLSLFSNETVEPLGNNVNSYGSPSPVIEKDAVYIHFGSYGTTAIDTNSGKEIWKRTDLECRHFRGPGSSPIIFQDMLILTMDGVDFQYVIALDKKTGKTKWKTERSTKWDDVEPDGKIRGDGDLRKAYTTPTFMKVSGKTIMISPGAKSCFAYNPINGKELWNITYSGYSNASRTVIYKDNAIINSGYGKPHLISVKIDPSAAGDISGTHINWDIFKRVPKRSSPIIVGDQLYMTTDEGILTCLDAKTGESNWSDRMPGHYSASPIFADGKLYFFSEMGHCYVIAPGGDYNLISKNKLDSGFMASPAISGKAIYARSKTHLYRIENL